MGELINFPTIQTSTAPHGANEDINNPIGAKVLRFGNVAGADTEKRTIKSCLFEGAPTIAVGGEVVVEVQGKRYRGIATKILQSDKNNNVTKIAYIIPFLSGDDSFKFGEADFSYDVKTHD